MARIKTPEPDGMTPEQREVHDAIVSGPRGRIEGPFGPLLHRPGLAAPAQALGRYCRYESALPPELGEIAICTVGRHWRAEYEWYAHRRMALQAGVSEAVLDAIRDGAPPPFADEKAEVVHAVAKSLLETKRLPEDLYARAERLLGREGLVDLVGIVGYYCFVSVTLNAFEVDLPPGETPAFPD